MICSYCSSPLSEIEAHNKDGDIVKLHECRNCGGHWAIGQVANEITSIEAANIDSVIPQNTPPQPDQPRCPICQNRLSLISHDSVAKGISIWACPQGHGNFFPNLQLLQFKKAQEAKITYHALWGIPFKSLVSVMLPVLAVLAVAGGLPLTLKQIQSTQENRTKASTNYTKPIINQINPNSALIASTTNFSATSSLKLYQNNTLILTKDISVEPSIRHQIILDQLTPNTPYTFTITYLEPNSKTSTTTESYSILLISANEQNQ